MDPASILFETLVVLSLLGVNAALIAAQSSLVAVRRSRMEQLAREGEVRARFVANALDRPAEFLAGARFGSALGCIALTFAAYNTLYRWFQPLTGAVVPQEVAHAGVGFGGSVAAHVVAMLSALVLVAWFFFTVAVRVPRLVHGQRAERLALWSARPLLALGSAFRPLFAVRRGAGATLRRLVGGEPAGAGPIVLPAEDTAARTMPDSASDELTLEAQPEQLIHGVMEFGERVAREVMTPRRDMIALPVTATRDEVLELVLREQHSRIPVYEDHLDKVVGVLLLKDLLVHLAASEPADFSLRQLMREPYFVPDTKPVRVLLAEFRARNVHLAIVLDEFGGTEGLVTLEDLIEEIVGEIYDEFDLPEPDFSTEGEDVLMDGGASIGDVNQRFGLQLPEQDFDTVAGFVFGELGRIPEPGDVVPVEGGRVLRVESTQDRRITRLRLTAAPEPSSPPS